MKKVLTIVGTRPEAIKMAPVIRELEKRNDQITSVTCLTGQHTSLLSGMLDIFNITPQYSLSLDGERQTLPRVFSNLISKLNEVIEAENPDWILAQGDTTSVVAGAIAAYYNRIKFGHIEAGLRTYDLYSPYPEEGNRLIADVCAEKLWAPTPQAAENLFREGYSRSRVHMTGNTVIDALLYTSARIEAPQDLKVFEKKKYILVTVHRRESFGENLLEICAALKDLSSLYPDIDLVYPVHPNPNVYDVVHAELAGYRNIHLLPPLGYTDFIWLMKNCFIVLTDSGGVQEEAPSLNIPVLVLRDKTERPEGVAAGVSLLTGRKKEDIVHYVSLLLTDREKYNKMSSGSSPYGDGKAAIRIVEDIVHAE